MKITLSVILDLFFFSFFAFLVSMLWFRYLLDNTFLIIILSIIVSVFIAILLLLIKYCRQKNSALTKLEKQEFYEFKKQLLTNNNSNNYSLIKNIFNLRKNSDKLYKSFKTFYFECCKDIFVGNNAAFTFYFDSISLSDTTLKQIILKVLNNLQTSEIKASYIYILCINFKPECNELINLYDTPIKLITLEFFYKNIVSGLNLFEHKKPVKIKYKNRINNFIVNFFSPKQTKHFLLCGITIFTASFIIRYNIYYIVFSSILFCLAIICQIRKNVFIK